jgi:hypothetical protein
VLVLVHLVACASVVEARLELEPKAHLAANGDHAADEPVTVPFLPAPRDRHEGLELAHPLRREEAGDEDVRVREIQLLRRPALDGGRDAVEAAPLAVEDGGEESNVGQQYQSIVPLLPTRATVWRSPMMPCSAIGRYSSIHRY